MAYIIQHISWSQPIIPNKLNDGLIWRGTIDSKSKDQIAQEHGRVMLECYIDPMLLVATSAANCRPPEDLFENEILPDAPHLKSGDFGEILCRSTLQEENAPNSLYTDGVIDLQKMILYAGPT